MKTNCLASSALRIAMKLFATLTFSVLISCRLPPAQQLATLQKHRTVPIALTRSLDASATQSQTFDNGFVYPFTSSALLRGADEYLRKIPIKERPKIISEEYRSIMNDEPLERITIYKSRYTRSIESGKQEFRMIFVPGNHAGESLDDASITQVALYLKALRDRSSDSDRAILDGFVREDFLIHSPLCEVVFGAGRDGAWSLISSSLVSQHALLRYMDVGIK